MVATRSAEAVRLTRRGFLAGTAGAGASLALGSRLAFASPAAPSAGDVIVVIFLRGGADGLNMVAPYQMPTYQALRPTLRVKAPNEFGDPAGKAGLPLVAGGNVASFPLSGTFALHPGMEPLLNGPWAAGRLAIVHAAGMPAGESDTRSHFDSERNWERGTASWSVTDGFLNRYLAGLGDADRLAGVGRGTGLPASLAGGFPAMSMGSIDSFDVTGFADNAAAHDLLAAWYDGGSSDLVMRTGASTLDSIGLVTGKDWNLPQYQPQNGATYGWDSVHQDLREVAQLIRADVGLRVAAIDMHGWDTHEGQNAPDDATSWYRNRVSTLASGLAAFDQDLGAARDEVTVITLTEFGRTIGENGNQGTDHGRASAMFVMGGRIKGGVYGSFPTTITDGPEGDLAVLNDYRRVVSEVLAVRGASPDIGAVFPTYAPEAPLGLALA